VGGGGGGGAYSLYKVYIIIYIDSPVKTLHINVLKGVKKGGQKSTSGEK
jgi:hypothetical protein